MMYSIKKIHNFFYITFKSTSHYKNYDTNWHFSNLVRIGLNKTRYEVVWLSEKLVVYEKIDSSSNVYADVVSKRLNFSTCESGKLTVVPVVVDGIIEKLLSTYFKYYPYPFTISWDYFASSLCSNIDRKT